jgi:16S rRNA (guanine(966)-N(2))-methyltransferase RsmD
MRVISGTLKGRHLKTPEGSDVRPTTDRVKESIFSAIQFEIKDAVVLDLFSGTGQLGIEALSRGAKRAVFADESKSSAALTLDNIKSCGLETQSTLFVGGYEAYLKRSTDKFNIIFLDPPYKKGILQSALNLISEFDLVCENGIIVCERQQSDSLCEDYGNIVKWREYGYGQTAVSIFRKSKGETDENGGIRRQL